MKLKLLLILSALFVMPAGAVPQSGLPPFITGKGMTLMVISPCKHCGVRSNTPIALKQHIYIAHTRKLPLIVKCNYVGCGKTFKTNKELMWHVEGGDHDIKKEKLHKKCGCRM